MCHHVKQCYSSLFPDLSMHLSVACSVKKWEEHGTLLTCAWHNWKNGSAIRWHIHVLFNWLHTHHLVCMKVTPRYLDMCGKYLALHVVLSPFLFSLLCLSWLQSREERHQALSHLYCKHQKGGWGAMNRPSTIALKCILTPTMEGYLAYNLGNVIV